jgi:hypothetical protein
VAYVSTGSGEREKEHKASSLPALPYANATPDARGARFEAGLFGRF